MLLEIDLPQSARRQHHIRAISERLAKRPSEMTFASIWKFGGAMQRVKPDATAFGDRSMPYMLSLDAIWSKPADDEANIGWVRVSGTICRLTRPAACISTFRAHGEDGKLVERALGAEIYQRLQAVKRRYDPDNVFRMNQNILPQ